MELDSRIYIAGHQGLVGSAIKRRLENSGFTNLLVTGFEELDLRRQSDVEAFFEVQSPEYVFLAAAKVGGIQANKTYPAEFIYDNLVIETNIIQSAYKCGVKKLLFLGSSCVYPRECPQPMKEDYLMTGVLEPTNEAYAIAKIAGLKMAQYYYKQYGMKSVCAMPCNLYGINDSFDPDNSHVLAALVKKFVDAVDEYKNEVVVWGSGVARREFMNVDDAAKAFLFLMETVETPEIINVGCGVDISIRELVSIISTKLNYTGNIIWDNSMPDGMLRKCLDISKLNSLRYESNIDLEEGIDQVIKHYRTIKKCD